MGTSYSHNREIEQRIARIKIKLDKVREMQPEQFGSESHRYRLNPTLSEKRVRAFEARYGIMLPNDYRAFVTQIGNGGAGPYYGVLPLEKWSDAWIDVEAIHAAEYLQSPSPLRPDMGYGHNWVEALPTHTYDPFQGTLAVCSQGCTYYTLLIVSGTARGHLLNIDIDLQPPSFVDNDDFLSWYERWLDETVAGYNMSWFGYGMPGTEPELLATASDPAQPSTQQARALRALCRLPQISSAVDIVVRERLHDSHAQIRAATVAVVDTWKLSMNAPILQNLLSDSEVSVREAALRALVQWTPEDAWPAIQRLLADPNSTIVRLALNALQQANRLTEEAIAPLLESEEAGTRQSAAYMLGKMETARASQLLLTMLNDQNTGVRIHALQALACLKQPTTVAAVASLSAQEKVPLVLINVINALEAIDSIEALPALLKLATHPSPAVRYHATTALGRLGDQRAIPILRVLLLDQAHGEQRDDQELIVSTTKERICDRARWALEQLGVHQEP